MSMLAAMICLLAGRRVTVMIQSHCYGGLMLCGDSTAACATSSLGSTREARPQAIRFSYYLEHEGDLFVTSFHSLTTNNHWDVSITRTEPYI